jgi:hypothetical protein
VVRCLKALVPLTGAGWLACLVIFGTRKLFGVPVAGVSCVVFLIIVMIALVADFYARNSAAVLFNRPSDAEDGDGEESDGDGGSGIGPQLPDGPLGGGIDWDDFDRARAAWRERELI